MTTDKPSTESVKKFASDKVDWFRFRVALNDKDRKAFLKNPKQYFRKFAERTFGKSNGVTLDSQFLSEQLLRAKKHKRGRAFTMRGVKCHIPQGPRACRTIVVKEPKDPPKPKPDSN